MKLSVTASALAGVLKKNQFVDALLAVQSVIDTKDRLAIGGFLCYNTLEGKSL